MCKKTHKLTHPLTTYREWFRKSNLEIQIENVLREDSINPIFLADGNINIQERLRQHWKIGDYVQSLLLSHVHYVLVPDKSHNQIL